MSTTNEPERSARFSGEQPGARCRVVLALDGDFAPHLVETLLSFSESTTAALASAVTSPA